MARPPRADCRRRPASLVGQPGWLPCPALARVSGKSRRRAGLSRGGRRQGDCRQPRRLIAEIRHEIAEAPALLLRLASRDAGLDGIDIQRKIVMHGLLAGNRKRRREKPGIRIRRGYRILINIGTRSRRGRTPALLTSGPESLTHRPVVDRENDIVDLGYQGGRSVAPQEGNPSVWIASESTFVGVQRRNDPRTRNSSAPRDDAQVLEKANFLRRAQLHAIRHVRRRLRNGQPRCQDADQHGTSPHNGEPLHGAPPLKNGTPVNNPAATPGNKSPSRNRRVGEHLRS